MMVLNEQMVKDVSNALSAIHINNTMSVQEVMDALAPVRALIPKKVATYVSKTGLELCEYTGEYPDMTRTEYKIETPEAINLNKVSAEINRREWHNAQERGTHFWKDPIDRIDIYDIKENDHIVPKEERSEDEYEEDDDIEFEDDTIIADNSRICAIKGKNGTTDMLVYTDRGYAATIDAYADIFCDVSYGKPFPILTYETKHTAEEIRQDINKACKHMPTYHHTIEFEDKPENEELDVKIDGNLYEAYELESDWDPESAVHTAADLVRDLTDRSNEAEVKKMINAGMDHDKITFTIDTEDVVQNDAEETLQA